MIQLALTPRVPCPYCRGEHSVYRHGAITFAACPTARLHWIVAVHPGPYDRGDNARRVRF